MINATKKHVTHKLHEPILTSDIGTNNSERKTSAGNTNSINTPNTIDNWGTSNNWQSLTGQYTSFSIMQKWYAYSHKCRLKQKCNAYKGKLTNQRKNPYPTYNIWKKTKQIIMDIDAISHSNTLHNRILKSQNAKNTYIFEHSDILFNCSYILIFLKTSACYTI